MTTLALRPGASILSRCQNECPRFDILVFRVTFGSYLPPRDHALGALMASSSNEVEALSQGK